MIIQEIRAGNGEAVSMLMDQYDRLLWGVADGILKDVGSVQDVEEVTADVFIHIWRHPEQFDPERGSLKTYLCVLARSKALDRFRALARHMPEELSEDIPSSVPVPEQELLSAEDAQQLFDAMEQLAPKDREIIVRRYFMDQKPKEISALMGIDGKQVENSLYRSKQKLKEMLKG